MGKPLILLLVSGVVLTNIFGGMYEKYRERHEKLEQKVLKERYIQGYEMGDWQGYKIVLKMSSDLLEDTKFGYWKMSDIGEDLSIGMSSIEVEDPFDENEIMREVRKYESAMDIVFQVEGEEYNYSQKQLRQNGAVVFDLEEYEKKEEKADKETTVNSYGGTIPDGKYNFSESTLISILGEPDQKDEGTYSTHIVGSKHYKWVYRDGDRITKVTSAMIGNDGEITVTTTEYYK